MKPNKVTICFSLVVALLVLTSAGGVGAQDAEALSLSIGYSVWVGYAPLFIAQDQGYFAEEGLEVELINVENPGDRFVALAGGQLNGLVSTLDTMAQYCNAETPFKAIMGLDESSGGDGIVTSPDITSVEDLRGKSIGVNIGSVSQFFLEYIFQENGLTDDDVTLIRMQQGDVPAALAAGRIDAGVTWEPHLSTSVDNGASLLVDSSTTPGLIVDILVLNQDVIDEHPEAAVGLVNAWNKAIDFWMANPDEAATIMAEGIGGFYETGDDINADLGGVTLFDAEKNAEFFGGTGEGTAQGTLEFALDFYTSSGVITDPCAPEDMLDSTFVVPEGAMEATAEATEAS
jgi:NitT/TauT family transport system substrate-binding protein